VFFCNLQEENDIGILDVKRKFKQPLHFIYLNQLCLGSTSEEFKQVNCIIMQICISGGDSRSFVEINGSCKGLGNREIS
jgi:hypothetical protein